MWDLIVSVPDHCLSFYFVSYLVANPENRFSRDEARCVWYCTCTSV